jgi:FMN phosphatase YigB (HAD superfamily)
VLGARGHDWQQRVVNSGADQQVVIIALINLIFKMDLVNAGKASYNYEAALKQLNIKPETLSITDSEDQ